MADGSVLLGIAFMLMAGVTVTAEMLFSISMLRMQWPYWRVTATSCVLVMAFVAVLMCALRTPFPAARQVKWVLLLGFFGAIYWGLAVAAVQLGMDPGDVSALTSINIVIAAMMGSIFLKERFNIEHILAVTLSLSGALLIARPTFVFGATPSTKTPWYGVFCTVMSGFVQGCFFICGRKAGDVSAGHLTLSALFFSFVLCALLPWTTLVEDAPVSVALNLPLEAVGWTGVACATTLSSAFFSSAGSALCPAAISATVYTAASMFFGYLVQTIFFDAAPELITICGAFLMLAAVSLMALAGRRTKGSADVAGQNSTIEETTGAADVSIEDDDTESFASFIASEVSDFEAVPAVVRFRGHQIHKDSVSPKVLGTTG